MMVSQEYVRLRGNLLKCTSEDINLMLNNDEQIYIAAFDVPIESLIEGNRTQTLGLVFGLNTHIYFGNGGAVTDLEKDPKVMEAMQSLFISAPQVLDTMELTEDYEYYDSNRIRAYLKTRRGVYYKELSSDKKEDSFLIMLMNRVWDAILDASEDGSHH